MPAPAVADPAGAAPLDAAAFARRLDRLGPFERPPGLAVAVSGGPDSLALCLLADGWARAHGGRVVALTVDHGLRPEALTEAHTVAGWLAARGIAHEILTWRGTKPSSAIQAQARAARYHLLTARCRSLGLLHLLLGHHRDDLAETVAMREAHGSGPNGLAGMAAIREEAGVRLLRPLLDVPKTTLIQVLLDHGQPWLEDPSNRALRFERNRLRAAGALPVARLVSGSLLCAHRRHQEDQDAASWCARHARLDPLGWLTLPAEPFARAEPALARAVLSRALQTVGGSTYPPRSDNLERLVEALARPGRSFGRTLGGCIISRRRGEILICREPAAVTDQVLLMGDVRLRFDGRFDLDIRGGRGLTLRRLGPDGRTEARQALSRTRPQRRLPRMAAASLPALFDAGRVVAVPQEGLVDPSVEKALRVVSAFRPRQPLAGAPFPAMSHPQVAVEEREPLHDRLASLF